MSRESAYMMRGLISASLRKRLKFESAEKKAFEAWAQSQYYSDHNSGVKRAMFQAWLERAMRATDSTR